MSYWHTDFHSPHRGLCFEVSESIYRESSNFQSLEIVNTPEFGKVMLLDGVLMLTEKDEFVYHEMLCHPSLMTHPQPEKVLIIGGGDCGSLTRVLQHHKVQKVVQVEIDEMVTRVARDYFPQLTEAINDPRAELCFEDGIAYLKRQENAFDVILVDSTDPVGPAEGLFRRSFLADCAKALKPDGILCLQSESPWIDSLKPVIRQLNADLKSLFPIVAPYTAAIQTYQAGLWLFQMASKRHDPQTVKVEQALMEQRLHCGYYNAGIHKAAFCLPEFVLGILA
jgi:spermidine synthase